MSKILLIAALAHTINAGYCAALGDTSQVPWEDAPQWQKDSAVLGVNLHINNPSAGAEASHESWLAAKAADGWVYGDVKDEVAKTHPCFKPFVELSVEQQAKDHIFRAAVHAGVALFEAAQAEVEPVTITDTVTRVQTVTHVEGKTPVKYIGTREVYPDGLFASGVVFTKGGTQMVTTAIAEKMFRHPSVYVPGDLTVAVDTPIKPNLSVANESDVQDLRDQLAVMDKTALIEFANTHFKVELSNRATLDHVRAKVMGYVDQYGVA
ncbi:RyR domain-containing protein [Variovorax boronicumulans]|uniref:RyR domain-containing protein n=1 Tax=Variovorax boronicumulans TaxID=436515 RepID=UPI0012E5CB60|nr:RyR domain-containing protein [Variovorax boronicumulans]GER16683.1 hypothetical protein VCH24_16890 [Variovorax boronicumulans]